MEQLIRKITALCGIALATLLISNCATIKAITAPKVKKTPAQQASAEYTKFRSKADYPKSYNIYRNQEALAKASSANTRMEIDLSDQRMVLYVGSQVAIDTPCCTGKAGKRTPTGTFRIKEKIKDKRSTIFGSLYYNGKKVYGGDRRKYKGRSNKYVGASLPYWMRLTGDGIGIHQSAYVKRYPGSNGCVRTPASAVKIIYSKVRVGTKVTVKR